LPYNVTQATWTSPVTSKFLLEAGYSRFQYNHNGGPGQLPPDGIFNLIPVTESQAIDGHRAAFTYRGLPGYIDGYGNPHTWRAVPKRTVLPVAQPRQPQSAYSDQELDRREQQQGGRLQHPEPRGADHGRRRHLRGDQRRQRELRQAEHHGHDRLRHPQRLGRSSVGLAVGPAAVAADRAARLGDRWLQPPLVVE